ncbi:MAG: DUF2815 family protein [Lachnospiraceae bacterium]|nr:DUF2815 family protein [Lachnospiraceae bacterium]
MTTGKVRASYIHIFQPRVPENGGDPKFSVTLLIPKTDTLTLNAIFAEIEKAKQEGAQKAFNGNVPPMCKIPIYDGDGFRPSGEAFGEECRGCMVMTASAKNQPVIVDLNMQNIINPAEVYSGCYIRANINFFAYNSNGNKGIGCGLNAVQKIEDGEPLTMRISAEEAFGGSNAYTGMPMQNTGTGSYAGMPIQNMGTNAMPGSWATGGQPVQQMAQQTFPGMPAQQIDPITGKPMLYGGVMGIQ